MAERVLTLLDIHAVVGAGLFTPTHCWELWQAKNSGQSIDAARRNVLLHLTGLESRRPLDAITDPAARECAREVRDWFKDVFTRG